MVGAWGRIGRHVVRALVGRGHEVALACPEALEQALAAPGVRVEEDDVADRARGVRLDSLATPRRATP